jgi:hypothetical protein
MHERREFRITVLARQMDVHPNTIRYVLTGTAPKVGLAFLFEQHLGIPIEDWIAPAESEHAHATVT